MKLLDMKIISDPISVTSTNLQSFIPVKSYKYFNIIEL